jgi:D-alanine-D-alanine ligase
MKILFVVGADGAPAERPVGFSSSENLAGGLRQFGHETEIVDAAAPGFELGDHLLDVDAIVSFLYERSQLEGTGVPFVGSTAAAIYYTADKSRYKELISSHGVLTPKWEVVDEAAFAKSKLAQRPYVLKPIGGSSTIDTYIVHDPEQTPEGIQDTFGRYDKLLLEELIEGQEITVPILGDEALGVIEIIPPDGETFSYDNKYNGKTREIVDSPDVPQDKADEAQNLAKKIHKLAGMRHVSRTDMIIAKNGDIYVLETNGMPGQTPHSLLPKSAAAAGLPLPQLAKRLVELAISSGPVG